MKPFIFNYLPGEPLNRKGGMFEFWLHVLVIILDH